MNPVTFHFQNLDMCLFGGLFPLTFSPSLYKACLVSGVCGGAI